MAENKYRPIPELTDDDIARFWEKVDTRSDTECWLWTGSLTKGYGQFNLGRGRGGVYAHRLAYFLNRGIDPGPLLTCHECDQPRCCNHKHLWLGSIGDNNRDSVAKGRHPTGDNHHWSKYPRRGEQLSKLKESDIVEMRALHASGGWTYTTLSAKFGITRCPCWHIVNRRTWKHVA
jgi:hypothetical protein